MARGGPVRVDVGVGVEDRPAGHLVEELAGWRSIGVGREWA